MSPPSVKRQPERSIGEDPGLCNSIHSSVAEARVPAQASSLINNASGAYGVGGIVGGTSVSVGDGVKLVVDMGAEDEEGEGDTVADEVGMDDAEGVGVELTVDVGSVGEAVGPSVGVPVTASPVRVSVAEGEGVGEGVTLGPGEGGDSEGSWLGVRVADGLGEGVSEALGVSSAPSAEK